MGSLDRYLGMIERQEQRKQQSERTGTVDSCGVCTQLNRTGNKNPSGEGFLYRLY